MVLFAIVVCGFYSRLFFLPIKLQNSFVDSEISPEHPSPGMEKETDDISVYG